MAYFYTEEQVRAGKTQWLLEQLDPDQIDYCKHEAQVLYNMGLTAEDGHTFNYNEWLHCIAEETYRMNQHHRARYCAEMGEE